MVEKTVNVEVNASLQLFSRTREIDSKYPKDHKLLAKKDKNDANQKYWDRDKDISKAKSHKPSFIYNQPQIQAPKNNKYQKSCRGGNLATGINATKVAKKNKNKAKDLSYIKYYTYKQKS